MCQQLEKARESCDSALIIFTFIVRYSYKNIRILKINVQYFKYLLCDRRYMTQNRSAQWLSHVQLFATPWTVAHQTPLSVEFSRQEYWSALSFLPPGDLPNPGVKPVSLCLLHWQVDSLPLVPSGKPLEEVLQSQIWEDKMTKQEITSDSCKRGYNGFFRKVAALLNYRIRNKNSSVLFPTLQPTWG